MKALIKHIPYFIKFTFLFLLGCVILSFIQTIISYGKFDIIEFVFLCSIIFFTAYLSSLLGIPFFNSFSRRSQEEIRKKLVPAVFVFWLGALIIAAIVIGICFYLRDLWIYKYETLHFSIRDILNFTFRALAPWIFICTLIFFYILWRKSVDREQKLNEELLKFKYQTLRNHVNPHFLFNSLNTLSSLVNSETKKADYFIHKLSDIYRYILLNENRTKVSLNEELQFVKDYFELQKIRDEDKISLEIQIENSEEYQIIPVSLQSLIENALKHNSATKHSPLRIRILKDLDCLVVINNIQRKTVINESPKTGLKNLAERVKLITNKDITIVETRDEFAVKIPILK